LGTFSGKSHGDKNKKSFESFPAIACHTLPVAGIFRIQEIPKAENTR
jgi:hypothetical protein